MYSQSEVRRTVIFYLKPTSKNLKIFSNVSVHLVKVYPFLLVSAHHCYVISLTVPKKTLHSEVLAIAKLSSVAKLHGTNVILLPSCREAGNCSSAIHLDRKNAHLWWLQLFV